MKKIIIFLTIIFPINVLAQNIYSDNYYIEGENDKNYPYKDTYIEKESTYQKEYPEEKKNRTIIKEEKDGYRNLKKVNRIVIRNFSLVDTIRITEIEITYKEKEIDYQASCLRCSGFAQYNLNNKLLSDSDGYLRYDSIIDLKLNNYYDPEYLNIKITFYFNEKDISFTMYWYDNIKDDDIKMPKNNNKEYIVFKDTIEKEKMNVVNKYIYQKNYTLEEENIKKYLWDDEISLEHNKYYKKDKITLYKYIDKLYKYYLTCNNEEKIIYKNQTIYEPIEKLTTLEKEKIIENKKETIKISNIVEKNNKKNSKFYKFRYIYLSIIGVTLFLLGYMLIKLLKE